MPIWSGTKRFRRHMSPANQVFSNSTNYSYPKIAFFSFCILPTAASLPQLSLKPTHSSVAGTLIAWESEMPLPHRSSTSTNDKQLFSAPSGQKSNASVPLTATQIFLSEAPLWFEALRQTDPMHYPKLSSYRLSLSLPIPLLLSANAQG